MYEAQWRGQRAAGTRADMFGVSIPANISLFYWVATLGTLFTPHSCRSLFSSKKLEYKRSFSDLIGIKA